MSIQERPRIVDFKPYLKQAWQVAPLEGENFSVEWVLEEIEELQTPSIQGLENADSFTLIFVTEQSSPQGCYELVCSSGKKWQLFTTPISSADGKYRSQVVVF